MNLITMILNITLDQIRCDLISNRPSKIPVLPKFPSPQLLLYPRKLLKYLSRRDALQYPYYVCNRISRWKTQKYMNVIRSYPHLLNLKPMMLSYLPKHLFNSIPYIFSLNPFPIFRRPHQMVLCIVNRMCRPPDCHAILILYHISSALGRHTFHPRPQDGVFRCDLNKQKEGSQMKVLFAVLVILFLVAGMTLAEQNAKIMVATKQKSPDAAVSELAAQAPYLLIFDNKGKLVEAIENPLKGNIESGKLMLGFMVEKGITAVIGRDFCGDIIGVYKDKGITTYNFEGSAAEAVAKVLEGKVPEARQEDASVANHKAVIANDVGNVEIIAVAANGETPEAPVSALALGARSFLIFNKAGELIDRLANPAKSAENPGIAIANLLSSHGTSVVVAGGFGTKFIQYINGKGIKAFVFKGSAGEAVKNILKYSGDSKKNG
jgi:predicted Fe-Mo cluster-binding NifX family protein